MQKVTTFLTYNNQAEEAVKLYTSVIKKSRIVSMNCYPEGGPMPADAVMTATFELA